MERARAGAGQVARYGDDERLIDARARLFADGGLGADGGYGARWVKVEAPFPFYFPNTKSRRRAVPLHDLHHIATGYATDWPGEVEIAAWEIASGCGRYGAAWILNFGGYFVGLFLAPRRMYRAFTRGRHSRSLYHLGFDNGALQSQSVGELRRRLELDRPARATPRDTLAFAATTLGIVAYYALVPALIAYFVFFR